MIFKKAIKLANERSAHTGCTYHVFYENRQCQIAATERMQNYGLYSLYDTNTKLTFRQRIEKAANASHHGD